LRTAGPVDDERVGDHAVEGVPIRNTRGLAHTVAQDFAATEFALVAIDRGIVLDFGNKTRIPQGDTVAVVGP
jgi:hypothetical protein